MKVLPFRAKLQSKMIPRSHNASPRENNRIILSKPKLSIPALKIKEQPTFAKSKLQEGIRRDVRVGKVAQSAQPSPEKTLREERQKIQSLVSASPYTS